MGPAEFRELLEVGKEFKLSSFKLGELEVNYHDVSFFTETKQDLTPVQIPDADDLWFKHIEKLKTDALAGVNV